LSPILEKFLKSFSGDQCESALGNIVPNEVLFIAESRFTGKAFMQTFARLVIYLRLFFSGQSLFWQARDFHPARVTFHCFYNAS
jgi:hypothetical protein